MFYNYILKCFDLIDLKIDNRQIFAAKYLPYMPTKEELMRELNLDEFEKLE